MSVVEGSLLRYGAEVKARLKAFERAERGYAARPSLTNFWYNNRMRFFFVIPALLIVGCGQESNRKPPPVSISVGASSGASSTGEGSGNGGAGGQGGAGGSEGGAGGVPLPTDAGPADPPCTNDLAYWSSSMSFSAPTPEPLGLALSELAYDIAMHPISIVLAAKGGVPSATLGVSATVDNGSGLQIFPAAEKPTFVPAFLSYGGFKNNTPQSFGFLHLVDKAGPLTIELDEITVKVTTTSNCSNIVAILDAIIPKSEGGKTLHLMSGDSTIADLGGSGGGGEKDASSEAWVVRAFFTGETTSFDFTTLP